MTKNIVLELVRIKKIKTLILNIFERKLFKSNSSDGRAEDCHRQPRHWDEFPPWPSKSYL